MTRKGNKVNRHPWTIGIIATGILVSAGLLSAQDGGSESGKTAPKQEEDLHRKMGELDEVNKEILELEKRLNRLRGFWQKNRAALERDLGRARRQVDARAGHVKTIEEKMKSRKQELGDLEKKASCAEENCQKLGKLALGYFGSIKALIRGGIPWRKERRLGTVATGEDLVKSEKPNPISILSAVERIQKREESIGRITESGTVRVEKDGEEREIQAFHLGRVALIFADKEGTVAGYVLPGGTVEDAAQEKAGHPDAMSTYIRAIDVLFKRRAPHIADLFFAGLPLGGKPDDAGKANASKENSKR
jgi:hypothetical protein